MVNSIGSIAGIQLIESVNASETVFEDEVVHLSFWQRVFDPDPTFHLWDRTRTIRKTFQKPTAYLLHGTHLIYHPALRGDLYKIYDASAT